MDERVLIPRSETEILVEKACEFIHSLSQKEVNVCEVGVGSGCIGLSLLQEIKNKKVSYLGTDISPEAIEVFEINYFRHQFKINDGHQVKTKLTDRLEGISLTCDVILSNPPYIKKNKDRSLVHEQVLKFEPETALFLIDSEYDTWFDHFFKQANDLLKKQGLFLMEGHESHLSTLKEKAEDIFKSPCEIIKDYTGRDRFIKLIK